MELGIVIEKIAGHRVLNHVFANLCSKLFVGNFWRVLRRNNHSVDAEGAAIAIFDGNLSFAVRTKVGKLSRLASLSQPQRQLVRELNWQRHQLGSLVASKAEHQTLIACAAWIYAHRDVG